MKIMVVDDEPLARRRLVRMLRDIPGAEVVAEAEDGEDALRQLAASQAEVLLLDIRMPGLDGMTLAQRHAGLPPIIFLTAHDDLAVQAFEVNALDYLLKPVRPERLARALARVAASPPSRQAVGAALDRIGPADAVPRVISAARGELRLFDAREVVRFWSSDKYTAFLADGAEQLTEEPLSALEARLRPHGFLRVHRGELVRLASIKAFRSSTGEHELLLADGQVARVGRRSVAEVKAALGL
jgi:DNA-binding LytR/AlgR family response regulator